MEQFYFLSICFLTLSLIAQNVESGPYIVMDQGFCNETYTVLFNTECQHCDINVFTDCPHGSMKLTSKEGKSGCEYIQSLGPGYNETKAGCYHTCSEEKQNIQCCRGYWGPQCQECPGGVSSVCSGHGDCDDTINGTGLCSCAAGYTGYVCELCINSTDATQNCSKYRTFLLNTTACQNTTCPENSECIVVDDEPVCMCQWPYVDQEGADNTTTNCTKVDMCQVPPLCHVNASCTTIHKPVVEKNCSCLNGFHGDGYVCDPVNPCQADNGGCPKESTVCVMDAPGQSHCECLYGYTEFVPVHGCHLIDLCERNRSQCHAKATCETVAPFSMECKCLEGYSGNGKVCYGNILQTIQDLNNDDPTLKGQLSLIQSAMEKYYGNELTQDGPFTVFVPTNSGFRTTNTANFEKWLDDGVRVRQVLRQHMLVGEFHTENLLNQSIFYTLQGVGAQLQAGRGNILKFNLHGDRKAALLKKNVVATNGMIHIVNRLMTSPSPATGDEKLSVLEVIEKNGQFNRLEMLIKAAGSKVQTLLEKDNITVFLPINGAFDSLPDATSAMEYLQSGEGIEKLKVILKSHIVDEKIEIAELIQKFAVKTVTNVRIAVKVKENGAVMLNRKVQITQSDIEARNGMLYTIDSVLLPAGVSTLPNKCGNYTYKIVKGVCSDCSNEHSCSSEDEYLNETASCTYLVPGSERRPPFRWPLPVERRTGCAALCNRTYITSECCSGFYGYDCLPCPGGYQNPCNGHGKCDDRISGSGVCTCEENFAGAACERCSRDNYFGPNCSQECTCIHGTCNNGPQGNGLCNTNRGCIGLYMGENCQKKSVPCSTATSRDYCHAHAQCIMVDPQSNKYSCLCKPGYRGDGEDCLEINPCTEPHRGGCHIQATCTKLSPGQSQCACNKGWVGDGLYCYPSSPCSNHSDCHSNAACLETTPGDHICKCLAGYHGDGKSCVLTDMCTVNNGNCHRKAICTSIGPGQVNCTCPIEQGYIGDGWNRCYGNIIKEIQDHPNLTVVADLLNRLDPDDRELFLDDDYTMFVPLDAAVNAFTSKASNLYWQKADNIITLLNYHTIQNKSRIIRWVALSAVYGKIDTMADGFSLHIFPEGRIAYVSPKKGSPVRARILEADIPATNGYLNIIDQVLEPYYPAPPDRNPDLETFFSKTPNCSIFGKWLKDKNLIDKLENNFDQYTLFVPSDAYAAKVNVTVTTDFLRYYIVPSMVLMASADDKDTVQTDLGADHQLVFNVRGWKNVTVNNVPISTPDIFTMGGLVNIIDGLLHPVLHMCNVTKKSVEFGICHECGADYLCPEGYTKYQGSSELNDCYYKVRKWFVDTVEKGCQGLCVTDKVTTGCCAGYFGPSCAECPGGPETPCHGNGHCSDGLQGNGECVCTGPFTGLECDKCIHGWTGPNCDIDMYGCGYKNGGCHKAAVCHRDDNGDISCKCGAGYRGNGYNCTGPCEINNGGCHRNADCFYKAAIGVTCSCQANYVGDGKTCNGDIYSTLLTLDNASQFVKSLTTASDGNTTLDLLQSSGQVMVFVPVDEGLNNRVLSAEELSNHIVVNNDTLKLDNSVANLTLKTLGGNNLIVEYDAQATLFLVNNTKVLKSNIQCTNGMINLISAPVTNPPMRSKNQKSATPIVAIVIPVVCVVVVVAIVVVAVVIYRKTQFGYWQLFHKWTPKQDSEGDTTSQARLSFNDPDNSGSAGNTNFGNPLYKMHDDDL